MKKLFVIFLSIVLTLSSGIPAFAALPSGVDLERACSLELTVVDFSGNAVGGGSLTLYKVADFDENAQFKAVDAMSELQSVIPTEYPELIGDPELSDTCAAFVKDNSIFGETLTVNDSGVASKGSLTSGLYLVMHTEPAEGYSAFSPFLVVLPFVSDGSVAYDVRMKTKPIETVSEETTTKTPEETTTGEDTTKVPSKPIPRTGRFRCSFFSASLWLSPEYSLS